MRIKLTRRVSLNYFFLDITVLTIMNKRKQTTAMQAIVNNKAISDYIINLD
tara:strand:+ start:126 stop:278 length:153 start_codon:yes stop_codon:yes gene_type:complete